MKVPDRVTGMGPVARGARRKCTNCLIESVVLERRQDKKEPFGWKRFERKGLDRRGRVGTADARPRSRRRQNGSGQSTDQFKSYGLLKSHSCHSPPVASVPAAVPAPVSAPVAASVTPAPAAAVVPATTWAAKPKKARGAKKF